MEANRSDLVRTVHIESDSASKTRNRRWTGDMAMKPESILFTLAAAAGIGTTLAMIVMAVLSIAIYGW